MTTVLEEPQMHQLRAIYLNLVRKSLEIQKTGNIQAFATVAKEAEKVAQQIQNLSRRGRT